MPSTHEEEEDRESKRRTRGGRSGGSDRRSSRRNRDAIDSSSRSQSKQSSRHSRGDLSKSRRSEAGSLDESDRQSQQSSRHSRGDLSKSRRSEAGGLDESDRRSKDRARRERRENSSNAEVKPGAYSSSETNDSSRRKASRSGASTSRGTRSSGRSRTHDRDRREKDMARRNTAAPSVPGAVASGSGSTQDRDRREKDKARRNTAAASVPGAVASTAKSAGDRKRDRERNRASSKPGATSASPNSPAARKERSKGNSGRKVVASNGVGDNAVRSKLASAGLLGDDEEKATGLASSPDGEIMVEAMAVDEEAERERSTPAAERNVPPPPRFAALEEEEAINNPTTPEDEPKKKRRAWIVVVVLLLCAGGGVGAYFGLLKSEPAAVPSIETLSPSAAAPVATNTTDTPSMAPSDPPSIFLKYDPPNDADCERIKAGLDLLSQDDTSTQENVRNYGMSMEVELDSEQSTLDVDGLETSMQSVFVPDLAGCSVAERRRVFKDLTLENLRYAIASGKVTLSLSEEPCTGSEPGICYVIVATIALKLKGEERGFIIRSLMLEILGDLANVVPQWQLRPPFLRVSIKTFESLDATESPSANPTGMESAEPSSTPTITASENPTRAPIIGPVLETDRPTETSSSVPTGSPTKAPTAAATPEPTFFPTRTPTIAPSSQPTFAPVIDSTPRPTCTPVSDFFEGGIFTENAGGENAEYSVSCDSSENDLIMLSADSITCDVFCLGSLTFLTFRDICQVETSVSVSLPGDFRGTTVLIGRLADGAGLSCDHTLDLETPIPTTVPTNIPTPAPTNTPSVVPTLTASLAPTSQYQGCTIDNVNNGALVERDLSLFLFMTWGMTLQACLDGCSSLGYRYAAIQWRSQCFCGNEFGRYGTGICDQTCPGGAECGGGFSNSVYLTNADPLPELTIGSDWECGCFADEVDRDLPYLVPGSATYGYSQQGCIRACHAEGYDFAGLQNGGECWCGNDTGTHGPSTSCTMDCPAYSQAACYGDTEPCSCGGATENYIFKTTSNVECQRQYQGCTIDNVNNGVLVDRDLSLFLFEYSGMTLQDCLDGCSSLGYRYAGAQVGIQCFCGNEFGRYGTGICDQTCPGGAECGGGWSNSVYVTYADPLPELTIGSDWECGCFADEVDRDLPYLVPGSATYGYSQQGCIRACHAEGYDFAGLQNGGECWCGNDAGTHGPSTSCTMNCPSAHNQAACYGDTDICSCGGATENYIFKTTSNVECPQNSDPCVARQYQGCTIDNVNNNVLVDRDLSLFLFESWGMTLQDCLEGCSSLGYRYAGTQVGVQCFCGNEFGRYGTGICDRTCDGGGECGGDWSNSVYATYADPCVPAPQYQGCTIDNVNNGVLVDRDLSLSLFESSGMTLQACLDGCSSLGYMYAAIQVGVQCFCGNEFGRYGSGICDRSCPGGAECGGDWSNSVYSI